MVEFFKSEAGKSQEGRLKQRELIYRIKEKRRFFVAARRKYAYVWQEGRFAEDGAFWGKRLSEPSSVTEVKSGQAMSFQLSTKADFDAFSTAVKKELTDAHFSEEQDFKGPATDE